MPQGEIVVTFKTGQVMGEVLTEKKTAEALEKLELGGLKRESQNGQSIGQEASEGRRADPRRRRLSRLSLHPGQPQPGGKVLLRDSRS